jgi:hypothetical protein
MGHFEAGQWADLVRNLVEEKQQAAMEAHISAGCAKCRRTMEFMKQLADVAGAEEAYQPPDYAVHNAKSVYVLQEPEKVCILPRIVGRLVYDSFREPMPAGVRARHGLARHALYEAGDYSVDLRLEYGQGTSKVTLVGQIADRENPGKPMADLPVFLVSGKKIVARAFSNEFGEFQAQYQPRRRLRLYVHSSRDAGTRIDVALPGAIDDDHS